MFKGLKAILCVVILAISWDAAAQAIDAWAEPDVRAALILQKALKNNDRSSVAQMIEYPVGLDFPLPPVKTAREFLAHWDEFFDKPNIAELLRSTPEQIGWRGVMLSNGLVWFNNGKVLPSNVRTDIYRRRLAEAQRQESASLYPAARGYKSVAESCDTSTKHVRIQSHGDGFHYFVWPKGTKLSLKPEMELKGALDLQGSAGNKLYTFRNVGFRYEFYSPVICGEDCDDKLTVFRGDKEISSQACR